MISEEDFFKLVITIDKDLSESGIPIYKRPLLASYEILNTLSLDSKVSVFDFTGTGYSDSPRQKLMKSINDWYELTYGERVKVHPGPGSYVIEIAGEDWEVIFPSCFGQNSFAIDDNLVREERIVLTEDGKKIPEVNILWHVNNLTSSVASSLSPKEKNRILHDYMFGLNAVQSLRDLTNVPLMEQAKNDYDVAVDNLFRKYPDYNNSKWASLQFSEKTMKSKLSMLEINFRRTHNLGELARTLAENGIVVSSILIERVQCSAGVRYGEVTVTKKEAILAVKSALAIFQTVFDFSSFSSA